LTDLERRALRNAKSSRDGAPIVAADAPTRIRWETDNETGERIVAGKHPTVALANRLRLKGYVTAVDGVLRVTEDGLRAFNAVLPPPPQQFLHRRDGLTTRLHEAARDEPAVMSVDELRRDWAIRAEAARRAERERVDVLRLSGLDHPDDRIREAKRLAAERGKDVAQELRRVDLTRRAHERAVDALERSVREDDEEAA